MSEYTYDAGTMDEVLARHPEARKLHAKHGVMGKFLAHEPGFYEDGWSHPSAVALFRGKAVGLMIAALTDPFTGGRLNIEPNVFVLPAHRKQGIAGKLFKLVHPLVLTAKRARKSQKAEYQWSPYVPPGNKKGWVPVAEAVANPASLKAQSYGAIRGGPRAPLLFEAWYTDEHGRRRSLGYQRSARAARALAKRAHDELVAYAEVYGGIAGFRRGGP